MARRRVDDVVDIGGFNSLERGFEHGINHPIISYILRLNIKILVLSCVEAPNGPQKSLGLGGSLSSTKVPRFAFACSEQIYDVENGFPAKTGSTG